MGNMIHVLIEDMFCSASVYDGTDFSIDIRVVKNWRLCLIVYACLSIALLICCWCDIDRMAIVDRSLLHVSHIQSMEHITTKKARDIQQS
jgi:hypothetical protein